MLFFFFLKPKEYSISILSFYLAFYFYTRVKHCNSKFIGLSPLSKVIAILKLQTSDCNMIYSSYKSELKGIKT